MRRRRRSRTPDAHRPVMTKQVPAITEGLVTRFSDYEAYALKPLRLVR